VLIFENNPAKLAMLRREVEKQLPLAVLHVARNARELHNLYRSGVDFKFGFIDHFADTATENGIGIGYNYITLFRIRMPGIVIIGTCDVVSKLNRMGMPNSLPRPDHDLDFDNVAGHLGNIFDTALENRKN